MLLFFDTETTGKADFKAPFSAPHQPKLVQLGAMLCAEDGGKVAQLEFLVRPDGWEIPDEAANVHGFTTDHCLQYGFALKTVLNIFN
ncbi:MAG: 3'-5' exonuclease, partial [Armatimonadetes bacterium]|nr:3'-5' exonuclease [Armatimonadota bacterium]